MTDIVDKATRSRMMGRIAGKNTAPELQVRRYLHAAGLRYRLHARNLPGRPDIVLPRFRSVVFAHGCFWHRHEACSRATTPESRKEFWLSKFAENVGRDARIVRELQNAGWNVFIIWECELDDTIKLDELVWQILASEPEPTLESVTTSCLQIEG